MIYQYDKGAPSPLGCSRTGTAINFALFSEHASEVKLCLFSPGELHPFQEIRLDPEVNKTGWIWHAAVQGLPEHLEYGYRITGPNTTGHRFSPSQIVSDPYAKLLSRRSIKGDALHESHPAPPVGKIVLNTHPFDWDKDVYPKIPMQELVIYELHVKGLTRDASSHVKHPGTFLGIIEKIPHFKALGVNAIELMPIHFFDEANYKVIHPTTLKGLKNYWGYMTINYFSPMDRYGTIEDFKTMVKELHKYQIEVILDVVFNHTAEGGAEGLCFSFKGIDNTVYYILDKEGKYKDYTGCGNTLNCNHPVVSRFIIDVLRYWVVEMHVDGFRFDLASVFARDQQGVPLPESPLIQDISDDPILGNTKLIAEAWDAHGLYQVGSFASNERWAEWNGKYRDVVRRFIKGTDGQTGAFATAISGSEDLFWKDRQPYHSINFVTAHDGFTLTDLVSYNHKHNGDNGEDNRDGMNDNESWNCGVEGETHNREILALRLRQRKNFHLALMVSIGTPMILMGDEYGHTRHGNNNTWCQDNELNWFLWDQLEKEKNFFRFYTALIHFRKNHPLLKRTSFLTKEDVAWHGGVPFQPDWSASSRFIAYTLKDHKSGQDLYIAFNACPDAKHITLPPPPDQKHWYLVADTSLESPHDFIEHPTNLSPLKFTYNLPSYSALLAKAF
jgi:isoamylase